MSRIMTKLLLVAILSFTVVNWISCNQNTVKLKLRGIDCESSCSMKADISGYCESSIMINDKEYSLQHDGLNVAVIDQNNGNVEVKNFDQLRGLFFDLTKQFVRYFKRLNDSSVVVIVTQNSCELNYDYWYNLLFKKTGDMFKIEEWDYGLETAVLVGCKGKCPKVVTGKLPYSYIGSDPGHSVEIEFRKNVTIPVPSSTHSNNRSGLIIGVSLGILFLIILIVLSLYIWKRHFVNKHLLLCLRRKKAPVDETGNLSAGDNTIVFNNSSYNKQSDIIHITPEKKKGYENVVDASSNIYEATGNDQIYDHINYDTSKTAANVQTGQEVPKQGSEYCYVNPKDTVEKKSENTYYSPCDGEISRARSSTELTNLSASSADTCNNQSQLTFCRTQNIYYSAGDLDDVTEYQPLTGGQAQNEYQALS